MIRARCKFCEGPLNYVVMLRESVFPVTAPNIASHEGSENYLERWFAAIYERRRIDSADRFAIQERRQSHDRHIGSGWECAPSLLETCPQMIQAAACTMRNAAATASSQPVSLWAWDRAANLVCVALLVTILVLRTFFGFVSEQMLTLAYDAGCQAAPRRMLFWLDKPIRNSTGWPDHEVSTQINFRTTKTCTKAACSGNADARQRASRADRHPCR
jgi:hypothetical protein